MTKQAGAANGNRRPVAPKLPTGNVKWDGFNPHTDLKHLPRHEQMNWIATTDTTAGERHMLMCIAHHADGWGITWKSQETIGTFAAKHRRSVNRLFVAMEKKGLISTFARTAANGNTSPVVVLGANMINQPVSQNGSPPGETKRTEGCAKTCTTGETKRTEPVSQNGTRVVHKSYSEELPSELENTSVVTATDAQLELPSTDVAVIDPFDAWYQIYPRKRSPKVARKAYAAAIKRGATHAELAEAARWRAKAAARLRTQTQFIALPATFLNEDRWRDWADADATAVAEIRQQLNGTARPVGRSELVPAMDAIAAFRAEHGITDEHPNGQTVIAATATPIETTQGELTDGS